MYSGTHSRSSLFLVELIITIFFFSLSAVVCVRLFVDAAKTSREARDLTRAVHLAQDAAECFLSAEGDPEEFDVLLRQVRPALQPLSPESAVPEASAPAEALPAAAWTLLLDRDWEAQGSGEPAYRAEFIIYPEALARLEIRISDAADKEIYALEVLDWKEGGSHGEE